MDGVRANDRLSCSPEVQGSTVSAGGAGTPGVSAETEAKVAVSACARWTPEMAYWPPTTRSWTVDPLSSRSASR